MRAWCVVVLVAGCYQPQPAPGAPCAEGDVCPTGLVCLQGLCVVEGTAANDAKVIIDATPIDASVPGDALGLDAFAGEVGCSDGTREGFVDRVAYPTIAGCAASWNGTRDLRAAKTGGSCGGAVKCTQPSDACATSWHVCANTGDPADLSSRVNAPTCHAVNGAFVAASSHCNTAFPCVYTVPYPCLAIDYCSEPMCCGTACISGQGCRAGAYADPDTWIAGDLTNGCGALLASSVTGVMCCHD